MSRAKNINQLITAFILVFFSLIIGMTGFSMLEGYSLMESFYMTAITISTVGFGEIRPLSEEGRLFVSVYIIFNISAFAYFLSVSSKFLFEGELRNIFKSIISDREMQALTNHVIICGCGRNGFRAAEELMKDKVDFVIVDMNKDIIEKRFGDSINQINYLIGDATEEETLSKAGIERARALIAAVPKDSTNVFISLTARELNRSIKIIARATQVTTESKLKRAGADYVVMPDNIGGHYMSLLVNKPHVVDFLDMINGVGDIKLELEEIGYSDFKDEFHGKSIRELDVRTVISGVTFIGYMDANGKYTFNPNSATILNENEYFIVLVSSNDLIQFRNYFRTDA